MKKLTSVLIALVFLLQVFSLVSCTTDDIPPVDDPRDYAENDTTDSKDTTDSEDTTANQKDENFPHRYDSVPEEYKTHPILKGKYSGDCKALVGKVFITLVFVDDSTSSWTADRIAEMTAGINDELKKLSEEAASYGVTVEFSLQNKNAKVNADVLKFDSPEGWENEAVSSAGLPALESINKKLASENNADSAPVVFLFNKDKRSYAHRSHDAESSAEYALVFETVALRHELVHLYGAEDLYYPEEYMTTAQKYFPESIMLDSSKSVDELTAYLIGWTDSPSQNALALLADTAHITEDDISKSLDDEVFTGNGTKVFTTGTYTGDLVDGVIDGYGTMNFTNGNVYEGYWKNGKKHGQGKLTWSTGDVYEGNFDNDKRTGRGKMTWANGDTYEGDFENDERTGYGKFTWANGAVYEGNFENSKINGYGTYYWTSGNKYVGNWENGERHGQGTYYWSENQYYTGDWVYGEKHGKGTFVWENGATYTGDWVDGKMHGQGKYTDPDGNVTEGTFENDKFVG